MIHQRTGSCAALAWNCDSRPVTVTWPVYDALASRAGNEVGERRQATLNHLKRPPGVIRGRAARGGCFTQNAMKRHTAGLGTRSERQYVEFRKGTGKIELPFRAGEVNVVIQPGPSGRAAVSVVLDGKPVGDVGGADVGADGVARFDGPA